MGHIALYAIVLRGFILSHWALFLEVLLEDGPYGLQIDAKGSSQNFMLVKEKVNYGDENPGEERNHPDESVRTKYKGKLLKIPLETEDEAKEHASTFWSLAQDVEIRNDLPQWDCQSFVLDYLQLLEDKMPDVLSDGTYLATKAVLMSQFNLPEDEPYLG